VSNIWKFVVQNALNEYIPHSVGKTAFPTQKSHTVQVLHPSSNPEPSSALSFPISRPRHRAFRLGGGWPGTLPHGHISRGTTANFRWSQARPHHIWM